MAEPIRSYYGIKKTIDVYEKSFVIKSEGILSRSKREIPFNEISEITIKTGSFFSPKDTIILKGKGGDEEVRFAPGTEFPTRVLIQKKLKDLSVSNIIKE
ncbi:MAG: PH domain-containing protein [Lachnospiraceae bacterium]|nr:PH domain-containing protein [Lachnospiraceae bacterium]